MRVSDGEQVAGNQAPAIAQFTEHHGYTVAKRYTLDGESAWKEAPAYKAALRQALDDAHRGEFEVLIVWALDRITREGAEGALRIIRMFRERGVTLVSVQESWLNGSPEVQDILVSFAGWMAQQESKRRSERIKAGIERKKAEDPTFRAGGKPGRKDAKPRKRSGYYARQEAARAAREGGQS